MYEQPGVFLQNNIQSNLSSKQFAKLYPNDEFYAVPSSGYLYCSGKSSNRMKGVKCPLKIRWRFDQRTFCYIQVITTFSVYGHNHRIGALPLALDGSTIIKFESQITPEMSTALELYSFGPMNLPTIRAAMEERFSGYSFTMVLLKRVMKKILDNRYGPDHQDIGGLLKKCSQVRDLGGKFQMIPSTNGGFVIATIHYQTQLQAEYAITYPEVIFGDGTHNLTRENMIVMLYSTVDCLGNTVITGVTFNFSESSHAIVSGLQLFYKNLSMPVPKTVPGSLGMFMDPLVDPCLDLSNELVSCIAGKASDFVEIASWIISESEQMHQDLCTTDVEAKKDVIYVYINGLSTLTCALTVQVSFPTHFVLTDEKTVLEWIRHS